MSTEPPSAPGESSPPPWSSEAERPPFDPNAYPPPGYPPNAYPPNAYPPPGYPPPGYQPNAYPPPGYPPPGYPPNGQPDPGHGDPRQHAWRTPFVRRAAQPPHDGGPGGRDAGGPTGPTGPPRTPGTVRPRGQWSLVWTIVVVAIVAILVRSHHLTSNEVIVFCVLIPSVILHEISHGVVALWFGDDTAKRAGRITLNPLRHVTPIGTIVVPVITVIAGLGWFGWAKPVPVDVRRLRHPRNESVLVALAGPLTNLVLAAVFGVAFYLVFAVGHPNGVPTSLGARVLFYGGFINLWVACFNLIPIPPLDGSAVVERLIPRSWWPAYLRLRMYGMLVILAAIFLMSFAHTSPLQSVVTNLLTWWSHVVHAVPAARLGQSGALLHPGVHIR